MANAQHGALGLAAGFLQNMGVHGADAGCDKGRVVAVVPIRGDAAQAEPSPAVCQEAQTRGAADSCSVRIPSNRPKAPTPRLVTFLTSSQGRDTKDGG